MGGAIGTLATVVSTAAAAKQLVEKPKIPSPPRPSVPVQPSVPEAPQVIRQDVEKEAKKRLLQLKRAKKRTKTILTSPVGVTGSANVVRKSLLGQ